MFRVALLMVGLAVSAAAAPVYWVSTDQTGAQTQIDINHSSFWQFIPTIEWELGGGLFEMKSGSASTADVLLRVYAGVNDTGSLLDTVTLTNTAFCAQVGNCQQFGTHTFAFGTPVPLSIGQSYFVTLTSIALDTQSTAYFIKASQSTITDQNGTDIDPQPVGALVTSPEPGTLLLLGIPLAVLFKLRPTRRLRAAASEHGQ